MDLEGQYFVFDWAMNISEGSAFMVMQVVDGTLEDRFHPDDFAHMNEVGPDEDKLAIEYMRENGITKAYTPRYVVEDPDTFLGRILWWREEITDPDCVPGQWEFFIYERLREFRRKELEKKGIEVIEVEDIEPYVVRGPRPPPPYKADQLDLFE